MARVHWKLDGWLESRGLTRYQLAQVMSGRAESRRTTLYRMRRAKRVDLDVLADILEGLEKLTGERVDIADILEYQSPRGRGDDPPHWQTLAGLFSDPDAPGDMSLEHDRYIDEAIAEEIQEIQRVAAQEQ